jgi:hypothetical protein
MIRSTVEDDMEPKIGPTQFQAEIARLKAAGKLPELDEVLGAVAKSRGKYQSQILEARKQGEDNASDAE